MTPERRHEMAKKGAIAAAAAKKRKKGLREALLRLMEEEGVQERLAEALVRKAGAALRHRHRNRLCASGWDAHGKKGRIRLFFHTQMTALCPCMPCGETVQ